jgi:hypothetical protein
MIRLLFEPKARSNREGLLETDEYTRSEKKNMCVVCGSKDHHVRHYVVPFSYRHLFPEEYKSHVSHDIVVVCGKCNVKCSRSTQRRMNKIESKFEGKPKFLVDRYLNKLNKAANALNNHKKDLPGTKITEYEDLIRLYFKKNPELVSDFNLCANESLSNTIIHRALDVEYQFPNPLYVSGAELVVKSLKGDDNKITEFVRDWREFFLCTMKPQFLPTGWSIDYSAKRGLN